MVGNYLEKSEIKGDILFRFSRQYKVNIFILKSECCFVYARLSTGHPNFILHKSMEQNTCEILRNDAFVILYL